MRKLNLLFLMLIMSVVSFAQTKPDTVYTDYVNGKELIERYNYFLQSIIEGSKLHNAEDKLGCVSNLEYDFNLYVEFFTLNKLQYQGETSEFFYVHGLTLFSTKIPEIKEIEKKEDCSYVYISIFDQDGIKYNLLTEQTHFTVISDDHPESYFRNSTVHFGKFYIIKKDNVTNPEDFTLIISRRESKIKLTYYFFPAYMITFEVDVNNINLIPK